MIIEKIKLTNFRQYKNEYISFATDPTKNVTVILGDNTYGKTTLVCAFLWCLYRDFGLAGPILNSEVAEKLNEGEETFAEVQMDLKHNNSDYRITTKQIFRKTNGIVDKVAQPKTTIVRDGKSISDPQAVSLEVEIILKHDVKDYFFYDGENNRIESVGKKTSLKSAIYQMMGIDKVMELADFFKPTSTASSSVYNKLNNQLVADKTPELEMWASQKEQHTKELEDVKKEIDDNKAEIDNLLDQYHEKEKILSANKDIETDQHRKLFLMNETRNLKTKVDTYFSDMISIANGRNYSNIQQITYSECYKKFNLSSLANESSFSSEDSLSHINEKVIDQLIERGRCLCGAVITDENDARKHLEEAREHMEPNDYGRHLKDFCARMDHLVDNEESTIDSIKDKASNFLDLIEKIERNKTEISEIEERIKGKPDVGAIQEEANEIKANITVLEKQNNYNETVRIPDLERKLENDIENIKKLSGNKGNNKLINTCLSYAEVVYDTAQNIVTKKQKEIREELEKQVNEIFTFIYHGDRVVKIDDNFNIRTELKDGQVLSASGGTESVKNYSFVSGLIKLVKRHLLADDPSGAFDFNADDKYPLVLDAPFSGVDKIHTQNVCKILPEYCDQVIIVLLQDAFDIAEETLGGKIGKTYKINRLSETCSEIKEVK